MNDIAQAMSKVYGKTEVKPLIPKTKNTGKRKFCIVTKDYSGLGFALLNTKDEVIIAHNPDMEKFKDDPEEFKMYQTIGEGMVERFDLKDVMENRNTMRDYYFIFDGNHSEKESELLRKEGFKVALGGKLSYKMENDRKHWIS